MGTNVWHKDFLPLECSVQSITGWLWMSSANHSKCLFTQTIPEVVATKSFRLLASSPFTLHLFSGAALVWLLTTPQNGELAHRLPKLYPTSLQFMEWQIKVKYMYEHTSMWHCRWNIKTGHEVKRVPGLWNSIICTCSKCWLFQQKYQRIEKYEMNHIILNCG